MFTVLRTFACFGSMMVLVYNMLYLYCVLSRVCFLFNVILFS